jgi:DNA-binding PadR family transcriptional regulator
MARTLHRLITAGLICPERSGSGVGVYRLTEAGARQVREVRAVDAALTDLRRSQGR